MGVSLMLNGEFFEYGYIKKCLAYYLVAIVAFFAVEKYVNDYRSLNIVIYILLGVLTFNNVVTILQFLGNINGWIIGNFFCDISKSQELAEMHDSLLGVSRTPGIFGDTVKNAFYIAVLAPLAFIPFFFKRRKKTNVIFSIIVLFFAVVACFMTQQRTAFGLLLSTICAFGVLIFFKYPIITVMLSTIIIILSSLFVEINIQDFDFGRLLEIGDAQRMRLIKDAIDFISEHPIVGGPMEFQRRAGLSTHNLLLDSWIFAGIMGFIIMMILFIKTVFNAFYTCVRGFRIKNEYLIFISISTMVAMAYGLFHNTSYLTGEVLVLLILALMLKATKFERYSIN
jgi:hypothetical protein